MLRLLVPPAALLVALALTAPAQADVTASTITSPKSPHYALFSAGDTVDVAGTVKGVGDVDIVCANGAYSTVLATSVPAGGGAFAAAVRLDPLYDPRYFDNGGTCVLRAVPAGAGATPAGSFRGAVLALSVLEPYLLSNAGTNDGFISDYYLYAAGTHSGVRVSSFGYCGVRGYTLDAGTLDKEGLGVDCGGAPVDEPAVPLTGVMVDGVPAYPPGQVGASIGGEWLAANSPFPALRYPDWTFDEDTGASSVSDTDTLVKCGPDRAYPPTTASCTYFERHPVKVEHTTSVLPGAQVIRVVDRWSSTDQQPHRLDLSLAQGVCLSTDRCDTAHPEYHFPGRSGFAPPPASGSVPGPFAALEPIFARDASRTGPAALILPGQAADGARFFGDRKFGLEYHARTIPATDELTFTHYYVTTRSPGELEAALSTLPRPASAGPSPNPPASTGGGGTVAPAQPQLSRRGHVRARRVGRTFAVVTRDRVSCSSDCVVRVRGRGIVPARIAVGAGRTAKVAFRLRRAAARRLERTGRLRLALKLSARIGTGPAVTAQRTVRLRLVR
jgi:hypothetical protein